MTKFYGASALILLASASEAFHVQVPSRRSGGAPLCMSQQDDCGSSRRDFARNFGAATVASILSLNAACASAAPSSSMYISSETIKTLDMSLPSYGSISDAKARLEAEEYEPVPGASKRAVRKSKPKKEEAGEQGGNPMGSLFPSMNKSIEKKESKQRLPKEEEDDGVSSFEGAKTMDMALPSYGDSTATKERNAFSF